MYEIIWNIDAYRAQQQGYGHPLQLFMSRKVRKEAKLHGENPPSRNDKENNLNRMSSIDLLSSFEWAEWIASGEILWWKSRELHDDALECRICKKEEERLLVAHHLMK